MPQASDIVLDGVSYMLSPGRAAYRRTQDGIAEGRTGRTQIRDFFGGMLRPFQLERDRFWRGDHIGPVYNGQGIRPWARELTQTNHANMPAVTASTQIYSCVVDDYIYLAWGNKVFRTAIIGAPSWGGFAEVHTTATAITGIANYSSRLLITHGTAADIEHIAVPTSGGASTILAAGERGDEILGYAGSALWHARGTTQQNAIRMAQGAGIEQRMLDNRVVRIVAAEGKAWAVTRSSLYSFNGRVKNDMIPNPAWESGSGEPASIPGQEWSGEWEPFFQHGNWTSPEDHRFLTGFGGRLYTNVATMIAEFRPDGDRAGWRDTGLRFLRCFGVEVAAGYLIACIESLENRYQIWAWDGSGWWLVTEKANDGNPWTNPVSTAGIGGWDVLVFTANTTSYTLFRLVHRSVTNHAIPSGLAHWQSPMIDCGERDKDKAWRKIGCVFADPDPLTTGSTDSIGIQLDYSLDGSTWVTGASRTLTGDTAANHNVTLEASIASAAAVSKMLMLRVRWSGLADWAPTLVDAWCEFEVLDSPARRRKWMLSVLAADQIVNRDGGQLTLNGRQIIGELWDAWQGGTTLTFRDIDYDAAPVERNVRIVGIEEDTDRPADHGRWGHSTLRLVLVEV